VDDINEQFTAAWERLAISCDDFVRTTQPRHHLAVEEMIRRIEAAGDLYIGRYEGWYCVGCEAFKREDELERDGDSAPRCPIHPTREVSWMEEENWFFRLSRYQDRLLKLLDERPDFIQPDARLNEIRNVIEGGLEDISVSRSRLPWGVPWPGDDRHTVYVWLDALPAPTSPAQSAASPTASTSVAPSPCTPTTRIPHRAEPIAPPKNAHNMVTRSKSGFCMP
jgi:methionyl-tRNA synthetase